MSGSTSGKGEFNVREGRKFGLLVGGVLVLLALLWLWRGRAIASVATAGAIGVLLVAAGLVAPARLEQPYRWWMAFARILSRVTTPIFMAVMYYGLLTPVALLRRAIGGNPLVARSTDGFWVERNARRGSMERQF